MKIATMLVTAIFSSLSIGGRTAAENYKKLSGDQIRAKFAGMQVTDKVHWREVYERDGTFRSYSMGRNGFGKWFIQKDELCRWKVSNPPLIAATAVVGLIAFPLLQPEWVMVK